MFAFRRSKKLNQVLTLASLLAAVGPGCGGITLSQGTQNDPVPTGNIVAQGNFIGVNGESVTGTVTVYQSSDTTTGTSCQFTVRLGALSAPTNAGLQVIPVVNGSASISPAYYTLRSPTGNENYIFTSPTATCSATFAQVEISNPAVSPQSAQNYGVATLTSPN